MKYHLGHIILAIVLTIAVTDYLWAGLLRNDQSVNVELEVCKYEKESDQKSFLSDDYDGLLTGFADQTATQLISIPSGYIRYGSTFLPNYLTQFSRLYHTLL